MNTSPLQAAATFPACSNAVKASRGHCTVLML